MSLLTLEDQIYRDAITWREDWDTWDLDRKERFVRWLRDSKEETNRKIGLRLYKKMVDEANEMVGVARSLCPIGFFVPSYDQAQVLNAWHPDYEPENAPGGYRSILDFTANRRGKALPMSAKVLTPDGYVEIGQLREGDLVVGSSGVPIRVKGIFPQGERPMKRIVFSDKSSVVCDEDHLWTVRTPQSRFSKRKEPVFYTTLSTKELICRYGTRPLPQKRCTLPKSPCVEFKEKNLPIAPYFVGLLLGDGCLCGTTPSISTPDAEIVNYCEGEASKFGCHLKHYGKYDYRITRGMKKSGKNALTSALRSIGMIGKRSLEKEIPAIYMLGSVEQRKELLAGLLDTDGFCGKDGRCIFYSRSEKLIDNVLDLARNLGCYAVKRNKFTIYKGNKIESWVVEILYSDFNPFRLPKKADRFKNKNNRWQPVKKIVAVEDHRPEKAICIEVDSEDGLFLLDQGILTHNTTVLIINTILWLIPNDPEWEMFQEREDEFGRGKYRVLPRPDFMHWKKTGKMVYPWLKSPPRPGENTHIWHAGPTEDHWNQVLLTDGYQKWIPKYEYNINVHGNMDINKQDCYIKFRSGATIWGKYYNADVLSFAGKACWILNLDEGLHRKIMHEILMRVQADGYLYWAYTPAEPRNAAQRAQLAHDCYMGSFKLIPPTKTFINFSIDTTPDYIIPEEKKAADRARLEGTEEGHARLRGGFFTSSPRAFFHFDRAFHILEMGGMEAFERFYKDAEIKPNLIRGIDEGIAHPAACVWAMLLPSNEFIIYREYSRTNRSIYDRARDIVGMSGNELVKVSEDKGEPRFREKFIREPYRRTSADWHLWARKNEKLSDTRAKDYFRAGLTIKPSTKKGPEERVDLVNDLFRKDHSRLHIATSEAPGCRVYITRDCVKLIERLENFLNETKKSGPDAGMLTGKVEKLGDDEIDGMCYCLLGVRRWLPQGDDEHDEDGQIIKSPSRLIYGRRNRVTGY